MVYVIMNITIPDFVNLSGDTLLVDTAKCFKFCVNPDYNAVLFSAFILLVIPYFGINKWIANRFNIGPYEPDQEFKIRMYKRLFDDIFYIGNAMALLMVFLLYNFLF